MTVGQVSLNSASLILQHENGLKYKVILLNSILRFTLHESVWAHGAFCVQKLFRVV